MSTPRPVRLVGVGSPHGDDAIGWEAVRLLREQGWADGELHTVEGGQRLLELLDGRGTLLLIDALPPAGNPGTLRRFVWPDERLLALRPGSTHDLRPAEALTLAASLGLLPPRVIVWGVEGASFEPFAAPTPPVAAALPELVRAIHEELVAPVPGDRS